MWSSQPRASASRCCCRRKRNSGGIGATVRSASSNGTTTGSAAAGMTGAITTSGRNGRRRSIIRAPRHRRRRNPRPRPRLWWWATPTRIGWPTGSKMPFPRTRRSALCASIAPIAAEKPKFIVMMIGNNDRQTIREKAPPAVARPAAPKANTQAAQPSPPAATPPIPAPPLPTPPPDAEQQPPAPAEAAEHANMTPEQARQASYGPWEFHTEKWELAYIRRIDATIAALKSAGVPVMWVGLPSQRGTKASADSSYLNELYRSRAEKAGIVYVDIWDGFVDEAGRYSQQGPDYEGQVRRPQACPLRRARNPAQHNQPGHAGCAAGAGRSRPADAECQAGRPRAAAVVRTGGAADRHADRTGRTRRRRSRRP